MPQNGMLNHRRSITFHSYHNRFLCCEKTALHSAHFYEARSSKNIGINNLQNRMPVKAAETLRSLSFTGFAINSFGVDSFPLSDPPQRAKILTKTTSFYIIRIMLYIEQQKCLLQRGRIEKRV